MKIIDLLNKIANGEEIPKSFVYDNEIYNLSDDGRYRELKEGEYLIDVIRYDFKNLNDEIEIIEDKKIETINNFTSNVGAVDETNVEKYIHKLFEQELILYLKINEIIKHINKGD